MIADNLFLGIIVTHIFIYLVQMVARKYTGLSSLGGFGVYLVFLPFGFMLFGAEFPLWYVAAQVFVGIVILLFSMRNQPESHVPKGADSDGDAT